VSKLQQWIAFAVAGILVILAAGWFLLVSPQRSKAADFRGQATTQRAATATLRTQLAVVRAQATQLPAKQAELAKFARQIPANAALPALVRALTGAATNAHVDLVSIAPGPPAVYTPAIAPVAVAPSPAASPAPGAAAPPAAVARPVVSPLSIVPLAIKVNGTYVQLEQFVANLEGLQRILLVGGYTLGPGTPIKPAATSTAAAPTSGGTGGCSRPPCNLDLAVTGQVFVAPVIAAPVTGVSPVVPVTPVPAK